MGHDHDNSLMTPEERHFNETLSRGDDYLRIELFRWALHYYQKAQGYGMEPEKVSQKIAIAKEKIRKETRNILIVAVIAVVVIALVWIF